MPFRTFACCMLIALVLIAACRHAPAPAPSGGYPERVEGILVTRCATAGCHNAPSGQNAGGLRLDTWEHLFAGGGNGAVVVPFSPAHSSLLYFINTDSLLGPVAHPTMPLNGTPLTPEEYRTIRDWIAGGAPDRAGRIPFSDAPDTRQKIYMTMQSCDLLGVIDAAKRVVMRYIPVGNQLKIEGPHAVKVDAAGRYAYVSFLDGAYVQKIDTRTDAVAGEVFVGPGVWNRFILSPDGQELVMADWSNSGKLVFINTAAMQVSGSISRPGAINSPYAMAANASFDTFYISSQSGNTVYKISRDNRYFKRIGIDGAAPVEGVAGPDPHHMLMAPDGSRYFVSCAGTNEVIVMDAHTDLPLKQIPVGTFPQELALSQQQSRLFVACMNDSVAGGLFRGSVYAIDCNSLQAVRRMDGPFARPNGLAVDERSGILYVANRNDAANGPLPHHTSTCGGRNGFYLLYDLQTLQRLPKRYEVSVNPYAAAARF